MESSYYTSGSATYGAPTSSQPSSGPSVSHSHPHHPLAAHSHPLPPHSSHPQQLSHSPHPHAHPVMYAAPMHPMAPHPPWMTPTAAFMPAGPTLAYGSPHAAMFGQWHPHSHIPHLMAATAAPPHQAQTGQAAAAASAAPANNNSNAPTMQPTMAFHSSLPSGNNGNNSSNGSPGSTSSPLTQRPIPQYATASNMATAVAAAAQSQASGKGKKQKAAASSSTSSAASNLPTASAAPLSFPAGHVQSAAVGGSGSLPLSSDALYFPSGDLHTAEGRARLMSDIRAMINDRKRNDVKRRYLAMKDKQTALELLLTQLKQQLDAQRYTEAVLTDRKQQLLDALMQYEGRRWIQQQGQQQQQQVARITSKTGRWVLCGKRKDNDEMCSHPVKKAKKGQTQKHCKHHQSRTGHAHE